MAERALDVEAVEVDVGDDREVVEVRALPERRRGGALDSWRGEVGAIAAVAAGGLAAGAAAVAAISAVRARGSRPRLPVRRGRSGKDIVASRSFLVDVHVLGR